jgi:hypothetical protein
MDLQRPYDVCHVAQEDHFRTRKEAVHRFH